LKSWILVGLEGLLQGICVTGTFTLDARARVAPNDAHHGDG